MSTTRVKELAGRLGLAVVPKGGPLPGACAAGAIDGFPVAVAWGSRQKQSTLAILVRFKGGSLKGPAEALRERIASSPELLAAMGRKALSRAEGQALQVGDDHVLLYRDHAFGAPKAEAAAAMLRTLVGLVRHDADPVGRDCEGCGSTRVAELCSVNGALLSVCAGCRERMGEEDRKAEEAYESRPANPLLGTAAGVAVAVVAALAWGGVAYGLEKIFLYAGILIGLAIAFTVKKGMGKVNAYGRVLTLVLTIASVLAGDFFFMCLVASRELPEPLTLDLAGRLLPHFFRLEFSDSSGYLSVLFGAIGAMITVAAMRRPVQKRTFVPITRDALT